MSGLLRILRRIWAFVYRRPLDSELEAELAAHLQMAIDDNLARGLSPREARRPLGRVSVASRVLARCPARDCHARPPSLRYRACGDWPRWQR